MIFTDVAYLQKVNDSTVFLKIIQLTIKLYFIYMM
jgi:hypothetical protein